MPRVRHLTAFSFSTSFEWPEMLARLQGIDGREWTEWWSDRWGEYLWSVKSEAEPRHLEKLRILWDDEIASWILDLDYESDRDDAEARYRAFLRFAKTEVLTLVDASAIKPVDSYHS